jgi:hypothetical protein
MPFPANIATEVAALNTAINAALPLESALPGTIAVLANQADTLVNDIDTALAEAAGTLDTFTAPVMAPAIVLAFQAVVGSGFEQLALCDLAGPVGRVATNLANEV